MSSKPPRLAPPHRSSPAWWGQPSVNQPKPSPVNFSAILAAAAVSIAGVAGILAWIATHPGKPHRQAGPALTWTVLPAPSAAVAMPPAPPLAMIPAVHRPPRKDIWANSTPRDREMPPPLLAPVPQCAKAPPVAEGSPAGETYGTQVLFLNNPAVAEEAAQRERKLLFVMHISGNFEDSCFT